MKMMKKTIVVCAILILAGTVNAAVTVNVTETGGDVLFDAAGTVNITDLVLSGNGYSAAFVHSSVRKFMLGHDPGTKPFDLYSGLTSIPSDLSSFNHRSLWVILFFKDFSQGADFRQK